MKKGLIAATAVLLSFSAPAWATKGAPASVPYTAPTIGETIHYKARYEDTMVALSRANDIGYVELLAANPGVDPWLPGAGTDLIIPKMRIIPDGPHYGVVINLPEMHIYYYPHPNAKPITFPIGIGREGLQTPIGQTTVRAKAKDFDWRPTPRMRAEDPSLPEVVHPGPDNPMGEYVLYLGWPEYGIHGTNKPYGIGRRSSSGCIRLYPEDIAALWPQVPQGTTVTVVNEPIKAAWIGNQLYVEAHPTMGQSDRLEADPTNPLSYELSDQDMQYIVRTAGANADRIDWHKVRQIVRERRGYPIPVARRPGAEAATPAAHETPADAAPANQDDSGDPDSSL